MTEAGDWSPGVWKGYDFASARKVYDVHVGRSYDDAIKTDKSLEDLVPKSLITKCTSPLVIACDVTGSMGEWPATIFEKLPLLDLEGKEYLGDDFEISFAAIGDAHSDKYPLQVQEFTSGTDLVSKLKGLIIEGGGGGQVQESYELPALYYSRNVKMPNAIMPVFIYIGDEGLYTTIDRDHAKFARTDLREKMSTRQAIDELKDKFSVYMIRKLYDGDKKTGSDRMSSTDQKLHKQWEDYLGEGRIAILPDPRRVVDVIFGLLAEETGKRAYFDEELAFRQKPAQIAAVNDALKTIHSRPRKLPKIGQSILRIGDGRR